MPQTVAIPNPPPPPAAPQSAGDQIREAARRIAEGALRQAASEIRGQLAGLRAQRAGVQARLDNTQSAPARADLQGQLAELDAQIAKLEEGLRSISGKLTTDEGVPAIAGTGQAPQLPELPVNNFDPTPLVFGVMGILFVAFPLTLALVRFLWKRASNAPPAAITQEQTRRFDRLEQSVDAIAIEVERISENQRYLTKLLGESKQSAKIGG